MTHMRMEAPTKINVTLPGPVHAWLRRKAAERRDGSMAAVIREALERAREQDQEAADAD